MYYANFYTDHTGCEQARAMVPETETLGGRLDRGKLKSLE